MRSIMNKIQEFFLFILRNITKLSFILLTTIIIVGFLFSVKVGIIKKDLYYSAKESRSIIYQNFLDSSSDKIEKKIYSNNDLIDKDHMKNCDHAIEVMYDEFAKSLNSLDKNLDIYTFAVEKDKYNGSKIVILVEDIIYHLEKINRDKYILVDHYMVNKRTNKTVEDIVKDDTLYEDLKSKGYILEDSPILNKDFIRYLKTSNATDAKSLNSFFEGEKEYFYNISVIPKFSYLKSPCGEGVKRKLGFIAIYDDVFISSSISKATTSLEFMEKMIFFVILITSLILLGLMLSNKVTRESIPCKTTSGICGKKCDSKCLDKFNALMEDRIDEMINDKNIDK